MRPTMATATVAAALWQAVPALAGEAPFMDVTEASGIDFVHFNGMSGRVYFPENVGAGAALIDFDRDGDLDVYLVQGTMLGPDVPLDEAIFPPQHPLPLTDRLYRNDSYTGADGERHLRFTDVTDELGLEASFYGMGVAVADVDGDGWDDLLVTGLRRRQLLINREGRGFEDATSAWGLEGGRWGVSATFFDQEPDGDPDLYITNYVEYRFPPPKACGSPDLTQDYCSPESYPAQHDQIYRHDGERFVEFSSEAGLEDVDPAPGLGVQATDLDGDGRIDLFVANDGAENHLWLNQGDGTYLDDALLAGVALNRDGMAEASMGVDAADFDGDGDEDLFMTHLTRETNTLYVNQGQGMFEDRSVNSGLGAPSYKATGFGTAWVDYDNDGWLDVLVANGAVFRLEERVAAGDPFPLDQRNQLFRNLGDGRFREVTDEAGAPFEVEAVSRGAAFGDLDDDGDVDVLITNNAGPVQLLQNTVGSDNAWVGLVPMSAEGRILVGTRFEVRADGRSLWRRARRDGSYVTSNDPRVLVGLGDYAGPVSLTAYWPDGSVERFGPLEPGSYHEIRHGTGESG